MARWSHDSVTRISVFQPVIAIIFCQFLRPAANRQNGGLRRIDDGGELVNAEHAQIGNGKTAAFIF